MTFSVRLRNASPNIPNAPALAAVIRSIEAFEIARQTRDPFRKRSLIIAYQGTTMQLRVCNPGRAGSRWVFRPCLMVVPSTKLNANRRNSPSTPTCRPQLPNLNLSRPVCCHRRTRSRSLMAQHPVSLPLSLSISLYISPKFSLHPHTQARDSMNLPIAAGTSTWLGSKARTAFGVPSNVKRESLPI